MIKPLFKENAQGRKHQRSCSFAEPELLIYRKPKLVVQDEKNGHENPSNSHNYHDEDNTEIELYQGNSKQST